MSCQSIMIDYEQLYVQKKKKVVQDDSYNYNYTSWKRTRRRRFPISPIFLSFQTSMCNISV